MTISRPWRLTADVVLAVAGLGIAVWWLAPAVAKVDDLGGRLTDLTWTWLATAVVLAVASLVAYGELHRQLLVSGGCRLRGRTVQAITFIANAITATVPSAGVAAGSAYAVGALRHRGVDTTLSVWTVVLAGLITSVTLLVSAPLMLATDRLLPLPTGAALSALLLVLTLTTWLVVQRPAAIGWLARRTLALAHRTPGLRRARWATQDPDRAAGAVTDHITHLRPHPARWVALVILALVTWGLDYLALAACLAATAVPVSWPVIAAGYLAVQASIAVQLSPGGTGPAEVGLLAVLVAGGLPAGSAAIVVVLYRGITRVGLPLSGWCVFLYQAEYRTTSLVHRTTRQKAT